MEETLKRALEDSAPHFYDNMSITEVIVRLRAQRIITAREEGDIEVKNQNTKL